MGYREKDICEEPHGVEQRHVHEIQGSVKTADQEEPHQHRFCTVSSEEIPFGGNDHVHEVAFRTDTFEDHQHEFRGRTGCAIPVGNRHVHFLESVTSINDDHRHCFEVATLINNPTGEDDRHDENHNREERHSEERHSEERHMEEHPMEKHHHMDKHHHHR